MVVRMSADSAAGRPPPGRRGRARRSSCQAVLPGGTSEVSGDDVGGVPVQAADMRAESTGAPQHYGPAHFHRARTATPARNTIRRFLCLIPIADCALVVGLWRGIAVGGCGCHRRGQRPGTAPGRRIPGSRYDDRCRLAAGRRVRRCGRPGTLPGQRRGQRGVPGPGPGVPGPGARPGGRPAGRVPHPGGRRPDARPGRPAGRGGAGQRPGPHRLFGPAGDARGPGHPRALRQHSAKKAIGCDQVPAGAPAGRLYECGDLAAFIAAVLGKPVLCRGAGPLDALEVAVFGGAWPPRWSMLAIRAAGNVRGKP